MFEKLDQLVNIDYNNRKINMLYEAARGHFGEPLSKMAAEVIENIPKGRFVFLATGSVTRSWVSSSIGETDGPLGTAILAKAIRNCRLAIPVILTEESLMDSIEPVLKAAGLCVVTPAEALRAQELDSQGYTSVACLLPFPTNDKDAKVRSKSLIEEMDPAAIICVEKAGRNIKGIYHNMRGFDYSQDRARVDFLVEEADKQDIPTIGIGDGGNEIGMGCVIDAVKSHVPYGSECQCPCSDGIASATKTNVLVTGSVSNWACYAICAALALKYKDPQLLPTIEDENRMINTAVISGHVDGATGKAEPTVDGFSLEANCSIISILREIVLREIH